MKYFVLLFLLLFSANTLRAEQPIEGIDQKMAEEVQLLKDVVVSTQQDMASQRELLNEQQSQIDSLDNSAELINSELSKGLADLTEATEKLRKEIARSGVSIKDLDEKTAFQFKKIWGRGDLFQQQLEMQSDLFQQQTQRILDLELALDSSKTAFLEQVENVNQRVSEAKTQLNTLGQDMGGKVKNLGYWVTLVAAIGVLGVALGVVVRKRLASSKDQLENNLSNMRIQMEEENVKLDAKLVELLQSQMKLSEAQSSASSPEALSKNVEEVDHTLPLKVGEEIFRMRQRLSALPDGTKGLKPLMKSLERLEDEFNQKGYELEDMLNKSYNDGMNVQARHIPSDELRPGEQIISKVIKPQIGFKGTVIQTAEIEVSTGE